jgi:hypothetical protein
MARGAECVARAARQDTLDRWINANKIVLGFPAQTDIVYAFICVPSPPIRALGETIAETRCDRNFPSELFMAQVGLAIASLSNFNGVAQADPPPQPKTVQALHVAATQKIRKEWADRVSAEFSAAIDKDILAALTGIK